MANTDWRGIALGVALGVVGQTVYYAFFYLFSGQIQEEEHAIMAGPIALAVLLLIFKLTGYLKKEETKTITKKP